MHGQGPDYFPIQPRFGPCSMGNVDLYWWQSRFLRCDKDSSRLEFIARSMHSCDNDQVNHGDLPRAW